MNTAPVRKIESTLLKRLARYNFFLAFFIIFFTLGCFVWMYKKPGGEQFNQDFASVMYAISSFIGAGWALQTVYRSRYGPLHLAVRYQVSWLLIFLSLFSNGIGGLCYWYLHHHGEVLSPSYADCFFLLAYPLIFAGLLLLPTEARFRMRMIIDAMITTLSVIGLSWYFFLGPQYFRQAPHATSFTEFIHLMFNLSYPTLDVVTLLALFLLVQRRMGKSFYIPYLLFMLAEICIMWANAAYTYLNAFNAYQTGNAYIDTFWFAGPLLCGLAGLQHYTALIHEAYQKQNEEHIRPRTEITSTDRVDSSWQTPGLHVYVPFVVLLLLCIYADISGGSPADSGLVVLTMFVSIIVAARYLLATRENDFLLRERERQRRDSENLRLLAIHLNQILDMDRLLERTVSLPIKELGFSSAILLIFSQKDRADLPLQVYATSSTASPATWYIRENALLQRVAQFGKEIEVNWARHLSETPSDIRNWLQQQRLAASYFLPLYYQDKLLGCLGVTEKRTHTPNQHMRTLGRAYCEQVATIIEHARLYQEAREHETFANAMTTIAVRLNSAVVDPAEIGDLICQEGAKALRADYVILYLTNEQGLLEPCALSLKDLHKEQDLKAWPYIYPHEYEAQALNASEPMLQQIALSTSPEAHSSASETHTATTRPASLESNSKNTRQLYQPTLRERLTHLHIHSTILMPLIVREKAAGILIFARAGRDGTNEYPPFNSTDLPLAQNFVEQARVAFTNARLYQRLTTAHQRLQELDQLKDQFMITASHELRTPLTAVQGYIELLTSFGNEITPEQRQDFLQKARQGCEELVVLLSNVMDASRLEMEAGLRPLYTARVSVNEVIESTLLIIEPQVTQEQREIHLHLPGDLAVLADPVSLRQVLINISANALKYSDSASPIGFFASANTEQNQVIISVADKGKGITPKEQSRVFQRFYRIESDVNSPVRGSGLGLYVSQRLVEAMGGKIWIESRGIPGEGSTFHIQLPMA